MASSTGTIEVVSRDFVGSEYHVVAKVDITAAGADGLPVTAAALGLKRINSVWFGAREELGQHWDYVPTAVTGKHVGDGVIQVSATGSAESAAFTLLTAADVGICWVMFRGI